MSWIKPVCGVIALLCLCACGRPEGEVVRVVHAGSLSVPFAAIERVFEAQHPGLDVRREAFGSAAAIRQVTELGKAVDVVASADYRLIDSLMIDAEPARADWNVLFARNAMGIAQRPGGTITAANWADRLRDPEVRVGMSDPNQDPCGYRSLFCTVLAEDGHAGLFDELVAANSNVTVVRSESGVVVRVPSALRYTGRLTMRPKETDLLALLETGVLDCVFIYRSVAGQHGLDFVEFPDDVSLSRAELEDHYGRVSVVQFADKGARQVTVQAGPIVYGITVPRGAPNPGPAEAFVRFAISEEGRGIMARTGQLADELPRFSRASRPDAAPADLAEPSERGAADDA